MSTFSSCNFLFISAFCISFIFEQANGIATNGTIDLLDIPFPNDIHKRDYQHRDRTKTLSNMSKRGQVGKRFSQRGKIRGENNPLFKV